MMVKAPPPPGGVVSVVIVGWSLDPDRHGRH